MEKYSDAQKEATVVEGDILLLSRTGRMIC